MQESEQPDLETDPRFPSGPWTGYFLQPILPGRHLMELRLTFRHGVLTGEGRDWVGPFLLRGRYDVADGKCYWTKRYLGQHDIQYQGYNEGKGIWGRWEFPGVSWNHGGFHIWPEGMAGAEGNSLHEAADEPVEVEARPVVREVIPV